MASQVKVLTDNQKSLLKSNYPMVKNIINSMRYKLPSHADLDELESVGVSGLVSAVSNYDEKKAGTFGAYASLRVRGAIIDELRKIDYMPRSARAEAKSIEKLSDSLEKKLGRIPNDDELRDAMGVSPKKFRKIKARTEPITFISINDSCDIGDVSLNLADIIEDENAVSGRERLERKEDKALVRDRLRLLPENQKKVVQMYYFEGRRLGEIAQTMNLTEARICQIHSSALKAMRTRLENN